MNLAVLQDITVASFRAVYLPPVRVLIGDLPTMLAEIVAHLLDAPDIELQRGGDNEERILAAAQKTQPDVVILETQGSDLPELGRRLFQEHTRLRVLGVSPCGRTGSLFELRPRQVALGELSPERLVRVVRERPVDSMDE